MLSIKPPTYISMVILHMKCQPSEKMLKHIQDWKEHIKSHQTLVYCSVKAKCKNTSWSGENRGKVQLTSPYPSMFCRFTFWVCRKLCKNVNITTQAIWIADPKDRGINKIQISIILAIQNFPINYISAFLIQKCKVGEKQKRWKRIDNIILVQKS